MTKIARLDIENVKRIKAVSIEPTKDGLTIVGGKNNQGKTSVLDSIAWALGGDRYRPSQAQREGSTIPPHLHIELTNGLIVERNGKNSDLKVIDPKGNKAGQQLLNEFISAFALDLPKFMEASGKEKANVLLQIIGVGDKLFELEAAEQNLYNQRHFVGQQADKKSKYAGEMTFFEGVPEDIVSPSELIKQQQEILAINGENERKRKQFGELQNERELLIEKIENLEKSLNDYRSKLADVDNALNVASKTIEQLHDESTEELERNIAEIDEINTKVRANLDKIRADDEAREYRRQYEALTTQIEDVRKEKYDLLNDAKLPLAGLSIENGELTYNGFKWDNMSGSEQLKVATAIVRKINPNCGFVLLDKLEQMDLDTLTDFGKWLESEGLQAIATRVSTGDECSVLITDGYSNPPESTKIWKEGQF